MKFTTVVLGLFAALAVAAPAPQPEAAPAPEGAKIEARQSCGQCHSGGRTCCGVGGCWIYSC